MRSHTRTRSPLRSAMKQRHRRLSAVAVQLRLLDAIAQATKAVAGGMQRTRRLGHVAQHPHAAVGREAADVAGKAFGKPLLDRGQCQRAQRVALPDARPLVRRRRVRGIGMAATGQRPQRAGSSTSSSQRGHCSASQRCAAAKRGLRMADARRVEPAPTPPRRLRPAPRARSLRANAVRSPCGRDSRATSTLLRTTLPSNTMAPTSGSAPHERAIVRSDCGTRRRTQ